jgi:hypothetical protein
MTDNLHNNPPEPAEVFQERIANWFDDIAKLGPVTDANASAYADTIRFGGVLVKEIDTQRDSEKRPHLEAGRQVDATYKPLIDDVKKKADDLKAPLLKFQQAKKAEADRIAREAAEIARKAEEDARRAQEEAETEEDPFLAATAEVVDPEAALAAARTAEAQALAAKRIQATSPAFKALSTRSIRKANVRDPAALAGHYIAKGNTDLLQLLERLANADIRHAKGAPVELPGVEVFEEEVLQ